MISSTTLMLATLVFNAAAVLGAPIRIPTGPDVVARAVVADPILPRVEVVDVQPLRKRSVEGNAMRPRFAREDAPEVDTRDTASSGSVSVRDLPEIEEIVRRFPRRALYERHFEKRSPEPSPTPPSEPAVEARSAPEPVRRFARRALYDRHVQRSETPPPPEARSDDTELPEKRSAPTTDNFPREPEPAPVPEPAPLPQSEPAPEVKAREQEPPRVFPRRILAEKYAKRQEESDPPAESEDPPAESTAAPEATPTTTPAPSTPSSTQSEASPTATAVGTAVPPNVDLNKVIADAIVSGTSNVVKHTQSHKVTDYKDTKIVIQIIQQQNSDVKLDPGAANANPDAIPQPPPSSAPSSSPTPTSAPTPTGTPAPTTTPAPTSTPTGTTPAGSGSDKPKEEPKEEGGEPTANPDGEPKPKESAEGGADPKASESGGESSSGSPAGDEAADPATPAEKRDLDNANAAAEPVTKRHLGLAGSLLASWTRRSM